jgi:hypothetical protein
VDGWEDKARSDDGDADMTASVIGGKLVHPRQACSSEASPYPLSKMRTQAMMRDVMFMQDHRVPLSFFFFHKHIFEVSCCERRVPTVVVGCVVNWLCSKQPIQNSSILKGSAYQCFRAVRSSFP